MVDLGFTGFSRPANDHQFLSVSDGDRPNVAMAVRMVSITRRRRITQAVRPRLDTATLDRARTPSRR
jgi:hypothetical protein